MQKILLKLVWIICKMVNLKTKDWEIKNIETVFFDKDGTFIDLHYFWGKMTQMRVDEIIKYFNLKKECFNDLCFFLGFSNDTQKMLPDGITALYSRSKIIEFFIKHLFEKYNIQTTPEKLEEIFDNVSEIFYQNMCDYTKPIKPAIDLIKTLHQKGVKLAIITADSEVSCNATLRHFCWDKFFDFVIARESTSETKESGKGALLALKKLNSNPKTTIMIGDTPMDFECAKNAGIENTILVATGQINKDELLKTSLYALESLDEIEII